MAKSIPQQQQNLRFAAGLLGQQETQVAARQEEIKQVKDQLLLARSKLSSQQVLRNIRDQNQQQKRNLAVAQISQIREEVEKKSREIQPIVAQITERRGLVQEAQEQLAKLEKARREGIPLLIEAREQGINQVVQSFETELGRPLTDAQKQNITKQIISGQTTIKIPATNQFGQQDGRNNLFFEKLPTIAPQSVLVNQSNKGVLSTIGESITSRFALSVGQPTAAVSNITSLPQLVNVVAQREKDILAQKKEFVARNLNAPIRNVTVNELLSTNKQIVELDDRIGGFVKVTPEGNIEKDLTRRIFALRDRVSGNVEVINTNAPRLAELVGRGVPAPAAAGIAGVDFLVQQLDERFVEPTLDKISIQEESILRKKIPFSFGELAAFIAISPLIETAAAARAVSKQKAKPSSQQANKKKLDALKKKLKELRDEELKKFREIQRKNIKNSALTETEKANALLRLDATILEAKTGRSVITESGAVDLRAVEEALASLRKSKKKLPEISEATLEFALEKTPAQLEGSAAGSGIVQQSIFFKEPARPKMVGGEGVEESEFAGTGQFERTEELTGIAQAIQPLSKSNLFFKQDTKLNALQDTSQSQLQRTQQSQVQKQSQNVLTLQTNLLGQSTSQVQRQQQKQRLAQAQRSVQAQRQSQLQALGQGQASKSQTRSKGKRKIRIPPPFIFSLPGGFDKEVLLSAVRKVKGVQPQIRQKGAWRDLGNPTDFLKAKRKAISFTDKNLAASFRLKLGSKVLPIGILPPSFRPSKSNSKVGVEKRRFRLDSSSEVNQILGLKRKASKNLNLFRKRR